MSGPIPVLLNPTTISAIAASENMWTVEMVPMTDPGRDPWSTGFEYNSQDLLALIDRNADAWANKRKLTINVIECGTGVRLPVFEAEADPPALT